MHPLRLALLNYELSQLADTSLPEQDRHRGRELLRHILWRYPELVGTFKVADAHLTFSGGIQVPAVVRYTLCGQDGCEPCAVVKDPDAGIHASGRIGTVVGFTSDGLALVELDTGSDPEPDQLAAEGEAEDQSCPAPSVGSVHPVGSVSFPASRADETVSEDAAPAPVDAQGEARGRHPSRSKRNRPTGFPEQRPGDD